MMNQLCVGILATTFEYEKLFLALFSFHFLFPFSIFHSLLTAITHLTHEFI